MALVIGIDDPRRADVTALLGKHLEFAHSHSAPADVHALDVESLCAPDIEFFSARDGDRLLGVGALKRLDRHHGEIKSMHTAEVARGFGIGRAMVEHLLAVAAGHGLERVSLETGSMEAFAPARSLYHSIGFNDCEPFGSYLASPASVCMTLELVPRRNRAE